MVLLNCDVGQGILFAGYKHVALQVIAGPEEARLITTKPEEILAKQAQIRENDKTNRDTPPPSPTPPAPPATEEVISVPESPPPHEEPPAGPSEGAAPITPATP